MFWVRPVSRVSLVPLAVCHKALSLSGSGCYAQGAVCRTRCKASEEEKQAAQKRFAEISHGEGTACAMK